METQEHNHDTTTDCTYACPAYWGGLAAVAEGDQEAAAEEEQTREQAHWNQHIASMETATLHNQALARKQDRHAELYDAVADSVRALSTVAAITILVRLFRKGGRA